MNNIFKNKIVILLLTIIALIVLYKLFTTYEIIFVKNINNNSKLYFNTGNSIIETSKNDFIYYCKERVGFDKYINCDSIINENGIIANLFNPITCGPKCFDLSHSIKYHNKLPPDHKYNFNIVLNDLGFTLIQLLRNGKTAIYSKNDKTYARLAYIKHVSNDFAKWYEVNLLNGTCIYWILTSIE